MRSNLLLTQSMLQLVRHFQEKGIALIPFKGPVLSHMAYQKPFHRYFEDLDFLVSQEQFQVVCDELLRLGLVSNYLNDPDYYRQSQFAARQTQVVLDLHYALTPLDCFIQIDTDLLLSELENAVVSGAQIQTFSVEDQLIILCVDAAKGYWRSMIRLVDIAELIRNQTLNWSRLERRARSLSVLPLVEMGLLLTRQLLDAPIPQNLPFLKASAIAMRVDEATLHRQVFKLEVDCQQSMKWHQFNLQALSSLSGQLKYFYRLSKFSMRNIPGIKEKIRT
ncbi:MAG: nucleotidyltransferase family protein [Acaryochloridaceae cyanobacterium RL_2_7]|nr:nucleotidyltransferase family protein [Acaryochloridaceae cyanobacterium RL_2_7]